MGGSQEVSISVDVGKNPGKVVVHVSVAIVIRRVGLSGNIEKVLESDVYWHVSGSHVSIVPVLKSFP